MNNYYLSEETTKLTITVSIIYDMELHKYFGVRLLAKFADAARRLDTDSTEYKRLRIIMNKVQKRSADANFLLGEIYNRAGVADKFRNIFPAAYMNELLRTELLNVKDMDTLCGLLIYEPTDRQKYDAYNELMLDLEGYVDARRTMYRDIKRINDHCDNVASFTIRQYFDADALLLETYFSERLAQESVFYDYMMFS